MPGINRLRTRLVQAVLFGALSLVGQGIGAAERVKDSVEDSVSDSTILSNAFRFAANRASPSLVTIYALRGPRMTAMWRRHEAADNSRTAAGVKTRSNIFMAEKPRDDQGSGIVIDRQGLILTCNHVVASADALLVILPDGRKFEAVNVRGDPVTDLAVIRIEGAGELEEVRLGNSDSVQVGDWVVSLGNPYELERSVSAGIVSAANRWIPGTPHPLIQNDAATNPGSSGGALLNLKGEVVGIITGGFSTGKEFQGIGLAIPANTAQRVVKELSRSEPTQRAYLGCETQKLTPAIARQLELPVAGGLYVMDVEKDSPAASAGIEQGDVITHFAGCAIDDTFQPEQLFDEPIPGNNYPFKLFRDGQSVVVDVEMGRQSDRNGDGKGQAEMQSTWSSEYFDELLGLGLDKLTADVAKQLEFPLDMPGVLVTAVESGSFAYKEGVAAGMVVLRINSHAIRDLDDYKYAASLRPSNKPELMLVQSNEGKHLVVFER